MTKTSRGTAVINEVGLRDGLQSISTVLSTEKKQQWIHDAYQAGMREIEVGSFVPPSLLPQMADTADLVAYAKTLPGLLVSVLVPNLKGAELALASGADLLMVPFSASHAHSLANLRRTPEQMIEEFARICAARDATDAAILVEAGISTAFGCTLQGDTAPEIVLRLMEAALEMGADRVSMADTVGYADPAMVYKLFRRAIALAGDRCWRAHFHDTRGLALANTYAALEAGITRFDASLAGIGGCPHAPGASGNSVSEDLAFMLASMGYDTGIDIAQLLELRNKITSWIEGEETHGNLWRAGLPKNFNSHYTMNASEVV